MHAGVMLDVSGSMVEELGEVERAALGFFESVLTPRDRAAVFTFADRPRLVARFTGRTDVLAGALAGLEAQGETHLYDALAFALHYFTGISGQRALVLLSDGFDTGSQFGFEATLDYARRTGVAIYAIGLGVPSNPPDGRRALDQLARETGGRAFYIERARELARVYAAIETEIRSQWLIAYQSSHTGEGFRSVEVEVARPGLEARTIRGYYP
jgi:Ca-activated chloride channel family protein